jgi:hypothetical protein
VSNKTQTDIDLERLAYEMNNYGEVFVDLNDNVIGYSCQYNYHKWQYYVGFHMERYWFCTVCDEKDYKRDPPIKPRS